ncbi:MAG TPA: cytochrome c, partial [Thermoanaerobaculia bacterium]|nr:cytochrome c [Thermoanaerobaculia bacterium]
PAGYFYDVMTNGFGSMSDYAAQIEPGDRWAIVAYIRALQLSQRIALADVPEADRARLDALPAPTPGPEIAPPSKEWSPKRDEKLHQTGPAEAPRRRDTH